MVDETKDVRHPGEGGTPDQGMHAGKNATGKDRGNDRAVSEREPFDEGGLPGQGTRAGKTATGAERGRDRS
jgi:hypothetical protein